MKLLMENFRQFILEEEIEDFAKDKETLTEEELRAFIKELCRKKNIHMTEEQLNEWVPSAMKRLGRRAGMLAALGGAAAPSVAAAAPGQGQMKDKITMMKQSVKDKAGDVKQKMQDLGVKIDDAGEDTGDETAAPTEADGFSRDGVNVFYRITVEKPTDLGTWESLKREAENGLRTGLTKEAGGVMAKNISGMSTSYVNGQVVAKAVAR